MLSGIPHLKSWESVAIAFSTGPEQPRTTKRLLFRSEEETFEGCSDGQEPQPPRTPQQQVNSLEPQASPAAGPADEGPGQAGTAETATFNARNPAKRERPMGTFYHLTAEKAALKPITTSRTIPKVQTTAAPVGRSQT